MLDRRITRTTIMLCVLALVAGCAAQSAFRQGNDLIASGDPVAGLAKLKEATDLEPGDTHFREIYFERRQQMTDRLLQEAAIDIADQHFDKAVNAYDAVITMDPTNDQAQQGLKKVASVRRMSALLDQADTLMRGGNLDEALAKVQAALLENPTFPRAIALQRELQLQQAQNSGRELGQYARLKAAYRKPVSLNLTNATVLQAFEALKAACGLNFMFDKDVKSDQRVTLHITAKPVEDIVRLMMAANQLDERVLDEDTVLIYPATAGKQADYKELVARSFYLSYADIKQMATLLKSIVHVREVFVDEKLNVIIVRDTPEVIRLAEKLIANEDVPDPEVLLELEVLEVSTSRLLQLGIQWPSSISATVQEPGGTPGQVSLADLHTHASSLVQLQLSNPLVAAQLLEQTSDSDLLANPRVRVRNRETAKILIGQRVPVITSNSVANIGVSQSVSYLDVGLKLEIEPTVSLDEDVSMKIALEVSSIQGTQTLSSGTQVYTLGTRNASTVLRVRDDETQILAGLIQRDQTFSNTGVPGLVELPVLNKLFGAANNNDTRSEIVLLITPHIVRNVRVPSLRQIEIQSGTENSLGGAPIQLGKSMAAPNAPSARPQVTPPQSPMPPPPSPVASPVPVQTFSAPPMIPNAPGSIPAELNGNPTPATPSPSPATGTPAMNSQALPALTQ